MSGAPLPSGDPRSLNAARRVGYRLLPGDAFGYLLHLRPREWPIMAVHTLVGSVLAVSVRGALAGQSLIATLGGLAIWVALLNGGTLALNSAFDRDIGDIGYLDAPPPPPRHLAAFGLSLMFVGQLLALMMPWRFVVAYATCAVLSLAYSVPPLRLKAVAGADWLINMIGFGTLTPYAGWAATGRPVTPSGAWVLLAFCPLFASLYPLTQLYQFEEDRARGDRTLALMLGERGSLVIASAAALAAFACLVHAARLQHTGGAGWVALAVAAAAWGAVLVPWLARATTQSSAEHKRGMYAALAAWAVTDAAVLVAFAG